jgi:hypothetical protein
VSIVVACSCARGSAEGRDIERSWHLLAEGDDGPYIPSMAIEAVIRKLLAGKPPLKGARSGVRALELSDYETVFQGRKIFTGFRESEANAPLYRKILGSAFNALPSRLQELHGSMTARQWSGFAEVRRGPGLFAALVAAVVGFPKAGSKVPVTVSFSSENGAERWTRSFGGKLFSSVQSPGTGKDEYLLVERFGIASFALALVIEEKSLFLVPRRWSLFRLPMPRFLLPSAQSFETERDGKFCFDVEIAMPMIGLIVAYKGRLDLSVSN